MTSQSDLCSAFGALTDKQHEVLALVADHRTSKEIASELGISESAVNQRIEAVRARLGGPPRAQMAREYRQFVADGGATGTCKPMPWQRIQLPNDGLHEQMAAAGSVAGTARGHRVQNVDGLQLPANPHPAEPSTLLAHDGMAVVPAALAMLAIVITGMLAAYFVTSLIGLE